MQLANEIFNDIHTHSISLGKSDLTSLDRLRVKD